MLRNVIRLHTSSLAGAILTVECILHSAVFAWLGKKEYGSARLATNVR